MTANAVDKLRGFRGLTDITLLDDDNHPVDMQLRSIRMKDVSVILELAGDEDIKAIQSKRPEDVKAKEIDEMMTAIVEVSKGMLQRTFLGKVDDDLAEAIVMRNIEAFLDSIFKQIERMLPKKKELKRRPQGAMARAIQKQVTAKDEDEPAECVSGSEPDKAEGKEGA